MRSGAPVAAQRRVRFCAAGFVAGSSDGDRGQARLSFIVVAVEAPTRADRDQERGFRQEAFKEEEEKRGGGCPRTGSAAEMVWPPGCQEDATRMPQGSRRTNSTGNPGPARGGRGGDGGSDCLLREAVWLGGGCVYCTLKYSELVTRCVQLLLLLLCVTRSADQREGTQTKAEAERDKRWGKGKVSWLVVESRLADQQCRNHVQAVPLWTMDGGETDRLAGRNTASKRDQQKPAGRTAKQKDSGARQTPQKRHKKRGQRPHHRTACGGKSPATLQAQPCPG